MMYATVVIRLLYEYHIQAVSPKRSPSGRAVQCIRHGCPGSNSLPPNLDRGYEDATVVLPELVSMPLGRVAAL